MKAVVFDLELVKRFKKGQPSEIVEIGACKVDFQTKSITDQFQIYMTPMSGYITKSTRSFINMPKEEVKKAVSFRTGIQAFIHWLGKEYYLCSWGKDDKLHFITQCVREHISLDWFINYNDIQQQIGKLLTNMKGQVGLKTALELAGIEPVGKAHRGIDDARNTAELFLKFADQIKLERNILSAKDIHPRPKKRPRFPHKTSAGKPNQPKNVT